MSIPINTTEIMNVFINPKVSSEGQHFEELRNRVAGRGTGKSKGPVAGKLAGPRSRQKASGECDGEGVRLGVFLEARSSSLKVKASSARSWLVSEQPHHTWP